MRRQEVGARNCDHHMKNNTARLFCTLGVSLLIAGNACAVELKVFGEKLPAMDFHGFASQGFLWNTGNNDYLGGDSSDGTFDFREYGVNGSIAYGKWRVGAQVFAQKLGPYGDDQVKLDWGSVDYQAFQWAGLRAGRVKMPRGLYNETLDLDFTRPFVLLPQSVYDARLRDFQASFDGGMLYGNISLKKGGSLDYKLFVGAMNIATNSGASDYFNVDAPFPNLKIGMDLAYGGTLFWNTPLQGLRVGASFSRFENFVTTRYVTFRGMNSDKVADTYDRYLISLEYTTGNWVFAAEGGWDDTDYSVEYPNTPVTIFLYPTTYYYYVSAAWRVKPWLELGAYYSDYHFDQDSVGTPVVFYDLDQHDIALCARFDITDYLIFKLEGHYLNGAGQVFDVPSKPQPVMNRDNSWFMFATKLTFSF